MKDKKDYIVDPKSCFNVIFKESECEHFNTNTKTFPTWDVFRNWIFSGPFSAVTTMKTSQAEEMYACYYKEFPAPLREKLKSRK